MQMVSLHINKSQLTQPLRFVSTCEGMEERESQILSKAIRRRNMPKITLLWLKHSTGKGLSWLAGKKALRSHSVEVMLIIAYRSWGGTIAGDVASYLPPGSMLGAVYIASHPTLPTTISSFLASVFLPVWNSLTDDNAAANAFPIAFNRLCFARDPHGHANYLSETLELNDGGADFVPENPAASYEIRLATMGMMATMKPLHRRLVVQHLNDDKILELLASGFPVLEVIGSHDSFLHCDIDIDAFKPIARNLDIHIIEGASHAPFIDAPDEVMGAIIKFANKVHLLSGSAQL